MAVPSTESPDAGSPEEATGLRAVRDQPGPAAPSARDVGRDTLYQLAGIGRELARTPVAGIGMELARTPLRLLAPLAEPVRTDIGRSLRRAVGVPAGPARQHDPPRQAGPAGQHDPPRQAGPARQHDPPRQAGPARQHDPPRQDNQPSQDGPAGQHDPAEHNGPPGKDGPPPHDDPPPPRPNRSRPFLPEDAVTRRVHGDLPSMMIGGLSALLLQTLHPLAMAGVAQHSQYSADPIGRLRRTAAFVGATTFGTVEDAEEAIRHVQRVHETVHGRAPDGRPYAADDPELVTWVHTAEMASFLAAARRFGTARLSPADADTYYAETAMVALRLGAEWVPTSEVEVDAYFHRMRPFLYAGAQAIQARNFLIRGVARRPEDRVVHACFAAAAIGILPDWARDALHLPAPPLVDEVVVTPAVWALCHGLRWAVRPS